MMSSEGIVQLVYNNVLLFLQRMLGTDKMSLVTRHINTLFPTWDHAWRTIHHWLREHPLTNMQTSIHSFAQLFPDYESFASELTNSLVMHDAFWNQVHSNLWLAKQQL